MFFFINCNDKAQTNAVWCHINHFLFLNTKMAVMFCHFQLYILEISSDHEWKRDWKKMRKRKNKPKQAFVFTEKWVFLCSWHNLACVFIYSDPLSKLRSHCCISLQGWKIMTSPFILPAKQLFLSLPISWLFPSHFSPASPKCIFPFLSIYLGNDCLLQLQH